MRHPDYEIRRELFKNPNLHSLALEMLVHDNDERVRYKIAKHLEDSSLIDEMILREESSDVLVRLAKNKHLSEEQQIALLKKKNNYKVWVYLAGETTSLKIMKRCFEKDDVTIKTFLARNNDLELSMAMELAKDPSEDVRSEIASETMFSEVLDYLADNENVEENLVEVAQNPATHNRTLYKLSKHPNDWVREAVASNENLSKRLKKRLLKDPSPGVRNKITGEKPWWFCS